MIDGPTKEQFPKGDPCVQTALKQLLYCMSIQN